MNNRLISLITKALFLLFSVFLPSPGFAVTLPQPNPWISLEKGVLELHKKYAPDALILNTNSFPEKINRYLDTGLWSLAEEALEASSDPTVPQLKLQLYHYRGEYSRLYDLYQHNIHLFQKRPVLMLDAARGALTRQKFEAALRLIDSLEIPESRLPEHFYISTLAYWGLKEKAHFNSVLQKALLWSEDNPDSPWSRRFRLLKVYYHLSQKEYDIAFSNIGNIFEEDADLALLALGWGYFKLSSVNNLYSVIDGFDAVGQENSPYYIQAFRIMSRFLIGEGNLRSAVEMDQRERDVLRNQTAVLEEEIEQLRKGVTLKTGFSPPGSLLKTSLLKLQNSAGEERDIVALLWYVNLQQRQLKLRALRKRERKIGSEQRNLQMEMVRQCMSLKRIPLKGTAIQETYEKARLAFQEGKEALGIQYLRDVLRIDPQSSYGEESAFRLGDIAFNVGNYEEAATHYKRILNPLNSPLRHLAVYKLSWTYYLQGKLNNAISLVIDNEINQQKSEEIEGPCVMIRTRQERREPYRLLALSLYKIGGPGHLTDFVKNIGVEESFPIFLKLATAYEETKNTEEMFQVIQSWVQAYPLSSETPLFHQKMVNVITLADQFSIVEVLESRKKFIRDYEPGSQWARQNRSEEIYQAVTVAAKEYIQFLMTHYYAEGQKTASIAAYQEALLWHQRYIERFPQEEEIGRVRFVYAELLSKMKQPEKAAIEYYKSAYTDPSHKLSVNAGFQEVALLEQLHHAGDPEIEQAYDRFAARFPEDSRTPEINMKLAEITFKRGEYQKSRDYAKKVYARNARHCLQESQETECPETKETHLGELDLAAYRLTIDGFFKEKDYVQAVSFIEKLFRQIPENEGLDEFKPLRVFSYFQYGEALKLQGKRLEAADAYWEAFQHGMESKIGPVALFEASALWDTAEMQAKSEDALQIFRRRYPQSAIYQPVLLRLASLYEKTGRLEIAALTYEEASRIQIGNDLSNKALEHALTLYERAESWGKVYGLAMEKVGTFPKDHVKGGHWWVKAAEAKFKLGEDPVAEKMLARFVDAAGDEALGTQYLAKAHLLLAEAKIGDFEKIKLVAPLEDNLERKKELFDHLLSEYSQVLFHPAPALVLNAYYRIGEILEEYSRSLLESERPQDLSEEEQRLYDDLLKEQALPYIVQAEETYRRNIDYGRDSGLESEWIAKSESRLQLIHLQIDQLTAGREAGLG